MKSSLRKSFRSSLRRMKTTTDHETMPLHTNDHLNSNSNLMKPVEPRSFLRGRRRRGRRHSSPSSPTHEAASTNRMKSKVFEPRYENHLSEENPFSSANQSRLRPLDRLTDQLRRSFRNTLRRPRSRLESVKVNQSLVSQKQDDFLTSNFIYPPISIGLTSPMTKSIDTSPVETLPLKRRRAPFAVKQIDQP